MATNTQRIATLETQVSNILAARKASGLGVVVHGDDASASRPGSAYKALVWIGSVAPKNCRESDMWLNL